MPFRLLTYDFSTLLLTSFSTVVIWFTDHKVIGGCVALSVIILNLAKAYREIKRGNKED